MLPLFFNDRKAGLLTEQQPGHGYVFRYDTDYLASNLPSISVTLPRRNDSYESASLFPFFVNMLPEGANRRIISRSLKIDENDFFGMLSAMAGKGFIGAVHFKQLG